MGSREERHNQHHHDLVPLAALISRELKNEKMEKPMVRYGSAAQSRKGEDYFLVKTDCQRVSGNPSTSFSVFGIFDGHNGNAAAIFSRDHLLNYVLDAIPRKTSGTTATFVIVDGWTVTVASVGDSRCILDSAQGGGVSILTVDHRLEENEEELVGPLRCWPGGLCLSRSIGDMDVGEFIVPIPYVKQVKEALRTRGLKDDTTCVVVDIIPPDNTVQQPSTPPKKYNKLKALFFRKIYSRSANKLSKRLSAVSIVEELFEEGSAMLAERLGKDESSGQTTGLFVCAVCQADLAPNEGISVHAGSIFSTSSKPWEGPFLCGECRNKKDAMEGKRPSGVKVAPSFF
ncbi:probable protein phosphatase 2c 15 [Phtheirospermum japonicum]|uniref:Probable protein phosphatase 2c 15 n=1 Tax=Phtheirospermum japonicum TaxID=374723 RepID=A0A830BE14_9LAMI|nr:probable protein phosphatase 2c 15 [Phtheirospermum japonicum]